MADEGLMGAGHGEPPDEPEKLVRGFSFKRLGALKQMFDSSSRNGYSQCGTGVVASTDALEKKGLVQRMHSLTVNGSSAGQRETLRPAESTTPRDELHVDSQTSGEDDADLWYRTWPERVKDKARSPKRATSPEVPAAAAAAASSSVASAPEGTQRSGVHVDVLLERMAIAYDPVTRRLVRPKSPPPASKTSAHADDVDDADDADASPLKGSPVKSRHRRQASVLSWASSTGSGEAPLQPLMAPPLHSNAQSYTSLSSLGNASDLVSTPTTTQSLDRSCQPPPSRTGIASFWQRTFARASFFVRPSTSDGLTGPSSGRTSGSSRSGSLNGGSSPTTTTTRCGGHVGSSGLILESRPANLPAKRPEEALHHQLLHQKLFHEAQRREKIRAQESEKVQEEAARLEEQIAQATKVWSCEILPQWDAARKWRKTRNLWWAGLPPSVRGQVWKLAIGNDLNVTPELFGICLERARERRTDADGAAGVGLEASADVIKLDLSRTFPHLGIFQRGGPLYGALDDLLSAYVCFRPDIGYVQGMSFVAATLLLNLEAADAFVCFANLLNRPLLHAFYRLDQARMAAFYDAYDVLLRAHLPKLHGHLHALRLSADLYLQEWIYTLYSHCLPIDLASRVWDLYCRDGDDFIFRTALGILKLYEPLLLDMDFTQAAQLLTNLPDDLNAARLFQNIEQVAVPASEKSSRFFPQILTHHLAKVKGGGHS